MSQTTTSAMPRVRPEPHAQTSNTRRVVLRMLRQPATIVAGAFIAVLVVVAILAPWISPHDPTAANLDTVLQPPSAEFLLGTDDQGRDDLSKLLHGTQIVLLVALGSVVIAALIGVPIGLLLGFNGGWWDRIGMRFIDMAQALPGMLIGFTVIAIFGRHIVVLMFGIGLIFASMFARLIRARVLVEREQQYVQAARVVGLSNRQIVFGQMLPNLVGPIITQGAVFFGSAIMIESAMSFLGIGLSGDTPTWGAMLSLALEERTRAPYLTWAPGIAIVLTVLAFNVFGDGINDALTGERRKRPAAVRTTAAPSTPAATTAPAPIATEPAPTETAPTHPLALDATGVTVALQRPDGSRAELISDVGLQVRRGEIVGLLGESGSGKSTFARAVLGMLPAGTWLASGDVRIAGERIDYASPAALRALRGARMGAVFQDPTAALSPVHRIGTQLTEPLRIHKGMSRSAARSHAIELLERVGVRGAATRLDDFPHQFSGGMAQRVAIAMALAAEPELLIADEATSALDVTTQAQVLDLLLDLRDELGMGILMITHSLGVVAETCDRAGVMYRGRLVEDAPVDRLFERAEHPYTAALLAANPANAMHGRPLPTLDTEMRSIIDAHMEEQFAGQEVRR